MRDSDITNFLAAALNVTASILNVTHAPRPVVVERTRVVPVVRRTVRVIHTERPDREYIVDRLRQIEDKLKDEWFLMSRERRELREEKRRLQEALLG